MINFENELLSTKVKDVTTLKRYIDFCLSRSTVEDVYCENHHILPKCLFPSYERDEENIVRLKYEDHVEAHQILSEAVDYVGLDMAARVMLLTSLGVRSAFVEAIKGDNNPAKHPDVRIKISKSKTGKLRPDINGKRYFGASEDKIANGIASMAIAKQGKISMLNPKTGLLEIISVNDPRKKSGELVSVNVCPSGEFNPMKNPESVSAFKAGIAKRAEKFSRMGAEEILDYCYKAFIEGNKVFDDKGRIATNYARLFKYAGLDHNEYTQSLITKVRFND